MEIVLGRKIDLGYELNLEEYSVLCLTNDINSSLSNDGKIILTTKEGYIWGIVAAKIVQSRPDLDREDIEIILRSLIKSSSNEFKTYYQTFSIPTTQVYSLLSLHTSIINAIIEEIELPYRIDYLYSESKNSFDSLVKLGLIEDPIFTTISSITFALLGLIPYGFTKKTEKGETIYKEIEAVLWKYENKKETVDSPGMIKLRIRLWDILKGIKNALTSSMEETINNPK